MEPYTLTTLILLALENPNYPEFVSVLHIILNGGGIGTHKKLQIQVLNIFLDERRKMSIAKTDMRSNSKKRDLKQTHKLQKTYAKEETLREFLTKSNDDFHASIGLYFFIFIYIFIFFFIYQNNSFFHSFYLSFILFANFCLVDLFALCAKGKNSTTEKIIQEQLPLSDCISIVTHSKSVQIQMVYARFIDEVYLDTENTLGGFVWEAQQNIKNIFTLFQIFCEVLSNIIKVNEEEASDTTFKRSNSLGKTVSILLYFIIYDK